MPDDTLIDLRQTVTELRRELDARTAERDEALAREAAMAEVLEVINSSPADLAPVFDAMLEKATRLAEASFGILMTYDGESFRTVALHGVPKAYAEYLRGPIRSSPLNGLGRLLSGERLIHIADITADKAYAEADPLRKATAELGGSRTHLLVPLLKDGSLLGTFVIYRQEVRPFTDKQIALVQNFAAQAVIAIENGRLITETREALEQQTETAEVLQVINSSPGDLAPVFDAMLDKAMRLCEAAFGYFMSYDGEEFETLALRGVPAPFAEFLTHEPLRPSGQTGLGRIVGGARLVHVADLAAEDAYRLGDPVRVATVDLGGARTWLAAALMKDDVLLGVLMVYRQEIRPFSHKQIALVENFAAQAVIAMENARLLTETREALDQQTATAEVLQVINSSPGDLVPVFDAMLEKAMRLCDASCGFLSTFDGERFHAAATRGVPADLSLSPVTPGPGGSFALLVRGEAVIHVADIRDSEGYRSGRRSRRGFADRLGARTAIWVALRKDQAVLGAFILYRQEVSPFSDKQIALLKNFAAQAVIAMENARLLGELQQRTGDLQESLEYQTATSDVLKVISRSTFDLEPVLDMLVETAAWLCAADLASLATRGGETYRPVATYAFSAEFDSFARGVQFTPGRESVGARALLERQVVHVPDIATDPEYATPQVLTVGKVRTVLGVPLLREGEPIGVISLARQRVEPFTERQIELVRTFADQAVIAIENTRLITETREALEQQTATAEVLQVINSSPGDLTPVFDAMLDKAMRLCGGAFGVMAVNDGGQHRTVAARGVPAAYAEFRRRNPAPATAPLFSRLLRGEPLIHTLDLKAEDSYEQGDPQRRALVDLGGARSSLVVTLRRDQELLGAIHIYRQEVRAFSDKQIALLQNFAAQAVIAIENARLLGELQQRTRDLQESLEYQTATSNVLQVISRSTFDLQPVLQTVLDTAVRLCRAGPSEIFRLEGDGFRFAVGQGVTPEYEALERTVVIHPDPGTLVGRTVLERRTVHVLDAWTDPLYSQRDEARIGNFHTMLGVPLMREGDVVGVIALSRRVVEPFSEREIQLVSTFADQAVIAIENTRLITETHEALEQQTATAEVLQVINSSPGDLAPVFDAMLEKALRLCGGSFGELRTYDGERFSLAATHGVPTAYVQHYARGDRGIYGPGTGPARILAGERVVHISDLLATEPYQRGDPDRVALVELGGGRAYLLVPLLKDAVVLGYIMIYRKEVGTFSDKQIALLQNFAAQAVIAMENARLLIETREALDQQTATAEVLQVINSSPGDLAPVFEAMLERAVRLCEFDFSSLWTFDGSQFRPVARHGVPERLWQYLQDHTPPAFARALTGERLVHIPDVQSVSTFMETDFSRGLLALGQEPPRSLLIVSLRRDDALLGVISAYRREVRPFSDKEIALLQNFAAQAVIAMENARLITETREALEQQTATAEILEVINRSPGDLTPVFDAILEKAHSLCGAAHGTLMTYDGEYARAVATHRVAEPLAGLLRQPFRPLPDGPLGRLVREQCVIHIPDQAAETQWGPDEPKRIATAEGGVRTMLFVPLRKDDVVRGWIAANRLEMRPFSDKEIALLESFAAQAVIAMENARLLGELRERTRDLEESLEYQTATSEVLKVISRSGFDLQPVLDTLLETAARLCEADLGNLSTREGETYRVAATFSTSPEFRAAIQGRLLPVGRGSVAGRAALEGRVVRIADLADDPEFAVAETVAIAKMRTAIGVPLLREGVVVGVLSLARGRVEPFTERQIELVRTFADQAVIAIENTRLITETREALEQQTATAEVLQVINSSPGDLAPVFEAMLEKAMRLCEATFGQLAIYEDGRFRTTATRGMPAAFVEFRRRNPPDYGPGTQPVRLLAGERIIHVPDLMAEDIYKTGDPNRRALVDLGGVRSSLMVPLLRDDAVLGFINIYRQEPRPFSDKQIALLESFAAQAVIAMDNARLLNEIRQRQAELRVTFDNMGDGVAMFDSELHLAAWNQNFQRILDLPDALLAERPSYPDYIRILAERGEFGTGDIEAELSRRLEAIDQELRLEHTRPDGRVIEVRRNTVPGGGFVVIYSDVTERKRAEEEIRAARDTAERALQELKTTQASLLHAQKMAALGQLTAGIAHEIKNPLNFVNNFAGLSVDLLHELKETAMPAMAALDEDKRAEVDEVVGMLTGNLEKIAEHGKRADGIVTSMLAHSRGTSGERQRVDINAMVEESLNLAYHGARAQDQKFNITLERDLDRNIAPCELVPQDVTRVLLNLFGNGFYAATKRSRETADGFRPVLKVTTRDLGGEIEIRVRDNGTGIPPESREKLFQPFFTTKPTGEGTGLGLSISYDIITQQHGGTIEVDSMFGEFTEFTIRLPQRETVASESAPR